MQDLVRPDIYQLLRHFRHDLLNDLQLGRSQDVIYDDANKMVARIQAVSSLFACGDNELATLLWYLGLIAEASGICLEAEVEPLPAPLTPHSLLALEQMGNLLLAELSKLDAENRFLYVTISPTSPQLLLEFAPLADATAIALLAAAGGWQLEQTDAEWRCSYVHRSS